MVPFRVIDRVLEKEELSELFKAIDDGEKVSVEGSKAATDEKGAWLKKAQSINLNENWHADQKYPFTTDTLIRKLFHLVETEKDWWVRYFPATSFVQVLGAKYSVGDYYREHTDNAKITVVLMLGKDNVKGGDLLLEGVEKVDFLPNRVVIFPSVIRHEVLEVLQGERYTVTLFFN